MKKFEAHNLIIDIINERLKQIKEKKRDREDKILEEIFKISIIVIISLYIGILIGTIINS